MSNTDFDDAKKALYLIIKKSRVHLYKPIQIAEILYCHRNDDELNLLNLETYRNVSKKWRDEISLKLVGRRCTSSQKYQDNLFENNALPPKLLNALGVENRNSNGLIEVFIYKSIQNRLNSVRKVEEYIQNSTTDSFDLSSVTSMFQTNSGLERSVDKMFEILVYALFSTVLRALEARVSVEIGSNNSSVLSDFRPFIKKVLGINEHESQLELPAKLFRVGVTNAADSGLDIWANFGTAFQVKHVSLNSTKLKDIIAGITADRIVIVCFKKESESIEAHLSQSEWSEKIIGIVTKEDLDDWYNLCLNRDNRDKLGSTLLDELLREFAKEFPIGKQIELFLRERGYDKLDLPIDWMIEQ